MRISFLRTLLLVIEQGGFSAAAAFLNISQPAVSQQVQSLEKELGVELLHRGRRGVAQVTVYGEAVLDFARSTLAAYDALRDELGRLQSVIKGELRLAASTTPGEYLVPQLMADFQAQHSQVEVRLSVGDTADVVRRVMGGECDLGFIGAPVEQPGLTLKNLAADEIVLAVYPEHPFAGREQVTWEEALAQPLIVREQGSGTRQTVEQALAAQGNTLPAESVALTLGSTQAVVQAIRDQLGIGFVSQRAIVRVPPAERLLTVKIEGLNLTRDLFIVYRAAHISAPPVSTFLTFLRRRQV